MNLHIYFLLTTSLYIFVKLIDSLLLCNRTTILVKILDIHHLIYCLSSIKVNIYANSLRFFDWI